MNEAYAAFKGLRWAQAGRIMAKGTKAIAKSAVGTGVKGFAAPSIIGALAGGALGAGGNYLEGRDRSPGSAARILRGAAYGALAGGSYRLASNVYRGGGVRNIGRMAKMVGAGASKVGRAGAFDVELAYQISKAKGMRAGSFIEGRATQAYNLGKNAYLPMAMYQAKKYAPVGMDYARGVVSDAGAAFGKASAMGASYGQRARGFANSFMLNRAMR